MQRNKDIGLFAKPPKIKCIIFFYGYIYTRRPEAAAIKRFDLTTPFK